MCGCEEKIIVCLSVILACLTFPLSLFAILTVVLEYQRAVVFRLGRISHGGLRGPGLICILPCIDKFKVIDLRVISLTVPTQEVLTKDSVSITVDAVVYYRIAQPLRAVLVVNNISNSTNLLAASTLRNVIGAYSLTDLLTKRDAISYRIQEILDYATEPWGVIVERVEIKDVSIPVLMRRAMATEAESARDAKAKVIAAQGELQASQALLDASNIIAQNPAALQLRYLQTLCTIAAEKNSTIIFPLPLEILSPFLSLMMGSNRIDPGGGEGGPESVRDDVVKGEVTGTVPISAAEKDKKPRESQGSVGAATQEGRKRGIGSGLALEFGETTILFKDLERKKMFMRKGINPGPEEDKRDKPGSIVEGGQEVELFSNAEKRTLTKGENLQDT